MDMLHGKEFSQEWISLLLPSTKMDIILCQPLANQRSLIQPFSA